MKQYLYDAFRTKENVTGILELIGYLFTSGNIKKVLLIITGVEGAGKSLFGSILSEIFNNKICSVSLQDIEKKEHSTSPLVNSHLNICFESSEEPIKDNSTIKNITGGDPILINPKFRDAFLLPPNEIPKPIIICNTPPKFYNLENALLDRLIYVHFKYKFRYTEKEDPELFNKLTEPAEMEWLIYNSIEAYKDMILNDREFIYRKDLQTTKRIANKFTYPLNYLIYEVIDSFDKNKDDIDENDFVTYMELNKILIELAKNEGMTIKIDKNNNICPISLLKVIRYEFDLYDDYESAITYKNGKTVRYYPHLVKTARYNEILQEIK